MSNLTPTITAEDLAAATAKRAQASFPERTIVDAGEYVMEIKAEPVAKLSKAGNEYLQLMLVHTGDNASKGKAVFPNLNANDIGRKQFAQLLLALGIAPESVVGATWNRTGDFSDGKASASIIVSGEELRLSGRTVTVYLKQKTDDYGTKNEVGSFISA
jgi:hypothetical protein